MAKAQFHKNQRVWVETVGTWAIIERVAPIWASGFDEPVRITYDVALGRPFMAHELSAEDPQDAIEPGEDGEWRLLRARNKWQEPQDCAHHPYPGTFPIVVTDTNDWGGWRVPGAEYDRDPQKIERQARLVAAAPRLLQLVNELVQMVGEAPESAPPELRKMSQRADKLLREVSDRPEPTPVGKNAMKHAAE